MMHMYHLTAETCLACSALTISCKRRGRHCNGEWFEERAYACGAEIEYSPNFSGTRQIADCTSTAAYKEKALKQSKAANAVKEFVAALDVDQEYKDRLLRHVYF